MKCDVCKFDMGDTLPDSGKCAGCGTPLGPAVDHERPPPGINVDPDVHGTYVVSDKERRNNPQLEGRFTILECDIRWGRGIGAETYGYYIKELREVVAVWKFSDHDTCPECGSERATHESGFDGCVAGYDKLHCLTCNYEFREEYHH